MSNQEQHYTMEEIMENPTAYIERFSEGSESLKEVLSLCYSNNISTRACCKGHAGTGISHKNEPYITFEFDAENASMLTNFSMILKMMKFQEYPINVVMSKSNDKILLYIGGKSVEQESSDIFFNKIRQGIHMTLNQEAEKDIFYKCFFIASKMYEVNKKNDEFEISYKITDNGLDLKIYRIEQRNNAGGTSIKCLKNTEQNGTLINYMNTLLELKDADIEKFNSSFKLNSNDIEEMYNAIAKLCEVRHYQ